MSENWVDIANKIKQMDKELPTDAGFTDEELEQMNREDAYEYIETDKTQNRKSGGK